jgi:hypothetical protein
MQQDGPFVKIAQNSTNHQLSSPAILSKLQEDGTQHPSQSSLYMF